VPDTFSILARKWSDQFYALEPLIHPTAMCLGGPNFDPLSITTEALQAKGFDESDMKLANDALCLTVYKVVFQ